MPDNDAKRLHRQWAAALWLANRVRCRTPISQKLVNRLPFGESRFKLGLPFSAGFLGLQPKIQSNNQIIRLIIHGPWPSNARTPGRRERLLRHPLPSFIFPFFIPSLDPAPPPPYSSLFSTLLQLLQQCYPPFSLRHEREIPLDAATAPWPTIPLRHCQHLLLRHSRHLVWHEF